MNGWRGPGALAIAFGHVGIATDFFSVRHLEPITLFVDFFFVLSGLVLAQAYGDRLNHAAAVPSYILRRFGRLWPLQATTLAILVAYELSKLAMQDLLGRHFASPPFSPDGLNLIEAIPTNLLLIQSLGIHDRETWNFPSWSISVEFMTYLCFAGFCLMTSRWRRISSLATILLSLAVLVFVAPQHMRSTHDFGLFRCLAGFFAGTLCHEVATRWRYATPFPTLLEIGALSLTCLWLVFGVGTLAAFAAPLVFSLFILAFVNEQGALSRLLSTRLFQALANWSFAIYMVHALVLIFTLAILHTWAQLSGRPLFVSVPNPVAGVPGALPTVQVFHPPNNVSEWLILLSYLAGVLLASFAAYRFVELPGRVYFARLAKRLAEQMAAMPLAARGQSIGPTEPAP